MKVWGLSNFYKAALILTLAAAAAGCGDMKGKEIPYPPKGNIEGFVYTKVYNEAVFARKIMVLRVAGRTVPDGYMPVEGADVAIQSTEFSDTTDADGRFYFEDVDGGTYTVQASKNGQTISFQVTVVDKATVVANDSAANGDDDLTLEPAQFGILAVNAMSECENPTLAAADVYIKGPGQSDFFNTGITTPAVFSDVAPGSYSVKLISGDFEASTSQTVNMAATSTQTLNFSLTPSSGNIPPYAQIGTPPDNASYTQGATVLLSGTAGDCEDGTLTGNSLSWSSNLDGPIGTGAAVTTTILSVATHTITLTATDSDGNTDTDTVTVVIKENTKPAANITSPRNNSSYNLGATVYFVGAGADPEDGAITDSSKLVWTSSLDGQIGTGTAFSSSELSSGKHTITLTVTDSGGKTDATTVSTTISNTPSQTKPTALILTPNAITGTTFTYGTQITFRGVGQDTEDGTLPDAGLFWTSSRDGSLGAGTQLQKSNLSVGTHTITLTVIDSDNTTGQATINITISAAAVNNDPVAVILTPNIFTGTTFDQGASISFNGQGLDAEEANGQLSGSQLVWTSSIDGQFGAGTAVTESGLSAGTHTITLTVTDDDGATDTAQVTVTVN